MLRLSSSSSLHVILYRAAPASFGVLSLLLRLCYVLHLLLPTTLYVVLASPCFPSACEVGHTPLCVFGVTWRRHASPVSGDFGDLLQNHPRPSAIPFRAAGFTRETRGESAHYTTRETPTQTTVRWLRSPLSILSEEDVDEDEDAFILQQTDTPVRMGRYARTSVTFLRPCIIMYVCSR